MTFTPAAAQSKEATKATDVGVTAKEIHVATIADVDNPLAPGLFKGAEVGAEAAAKYLNSKAGGGGIAGRKIVVDFIDSKLNANQSRNAVITACQNDFAMVGSVMLSLDTADDELTCPDKQHAASGIPDMAAFATSIGQSCSAVAFPASPPQIDCSTAQSTPQKYTTNAGIGRYLVKRYGEGKVHGAMIYANNTKDAERAARGALDALQVAGIKADQYQGISATTPQSGFTPIVKQMKADKSNFGFSFAAPANLIAEAQIQGLTGVTWVADYSQKTADTPVMDGILAPLGFLPFDEGSSNAMLKTFLRNVPSNGRDQFSVLAWAAMLAFADAARAVVAKDGVNGLTRKTLLHTGIPTLTHFDAGGMIGAVDIAHKISSPCYLVEQLKGGKYHRVYPKLVGTFDCKKSNLITTQADLIGS
jgi:hypothetical protein